MRGETERGGKRDVQEWSMDRHEYVLGFGLTPCPAWFLKKTGGRETQGVDVVTEDRKRYEMEMRQGLEF